VVPASSTADRWRNPWLGLLPVGVAFLGMAWVSWGKWADPIIDFGLQLYLPWQLAEGKRWYDDIAYLPGGPLSQHYHALLFRLFGPSLRVLVVSNLLILTGLIVLVYGCFLRAADRLTATLAGLFLVVAFAFSHYQEFGNYNYVTPYSHEVYHGLVLSVALVALWARQLRRPGTGGLVLAGLCYGLVFLTKPEIFLAASLVTATALFLAGRQWGMATLLLRAGLFAAAALIPLLVFFLYFLTFTPAGGSLLKVCWAWVPLLTSKVSEGKFYRTCLGLDAPVRHVALMGLHFIIIIGALAALAWQAPHLRESRVKRIVFLVLFGAAGLYAEWMGSGGLDPRTINPALAEGAWGREFQGAGRSLPLLMIAAVGLLVGRHWRDLWRGTLADAFPLLWCVFALGMLAKMGLHSHLWHYGAFLAMPAFLAAVFLVLWWLPRHWPRLAGHAGEFRAPLVAFLIFGLVRLFIQSELYYVDKTLPLGSPPDQLLVMRGKDDPRTEPVKAALVWIQTNTRPDQTLAVLPEGAMLNYLARRTNPTPYLVFMAEMDAFGEDTMLAAYRRSPPDFIALVHRDTDEYGEGWWGERTGFGRDMMAWVRVEYEPVHQIGARPFTTGEFGIQFLRRKR
jgi:hypothetical protein